MNRALFTVALCVQVVGAHNLRSSERKGHDRDPGAWGGKDEASAEQRHLTFHEASAGPTLDDEEYDDEDFGAAAAAAAERILEKRILEDQQASTCLPNPLQLENNWKWGQEKCSEKCGDPESCHQHCNIKCSRGCICNTEGWVFGDFGQSCQQACEGEGLECTPEGLEDHNSKVDSEKNFKKMISASFPAIDISSSSCDQATFGDAPTFRVDESTTTTAKMIKCFFKKESSKSSTFSCTANGGNDNDEKRRLCYCKQPQPEREFHFDKDMMSLVDARKYCKDRSEYLVVPKDLEETNKIKMMLPAGNKRAWVGIYRNSASGDWASDDSSFQLDYDFKAGDGNDDWKNFKDGEGNDNFGANFGAAAAAMVWQSGWNGEWFDLKNDGRKYYAVCVEAASNRVRRNTEAVPAATKGADSEAVPAAAY